MLLPLRPAGLNNGDILGCSGRPSWLEGLLLAGSLGRRSLLAIRIWLALWQWAPASHANHLADGVLEEEADESLFDECTGVSLGNSIPQFVG